MAITAHQPIKLEATGGVTTFVEVMYREKPGGIDSTIAVH